MKFLYTLLIILIANKINAQNLLVSKISSCKDSPIEFEIENPPLEQTNYFWDFDDGTKIQTNEPKVRHGYKEGGIYFATVVFGDYHFSQKIEIAINPNYSKFKSSLPKEQDGICLGQSLNLEMQISDTLLKYIPNCKFLEEIPSNIYSSTYCKCIYLKGIENQQIIDPTQILPISIELEHDNGNDLKIELISSSGKEFLLKDFDDKTESYQIGEPADKSFGKFEVIKFDKSNSVDDLTGLIGEDLLGLWSIRITSKGSDSEGYINSWSINLSEEILKTAPELTNTFDTKMAIWTGRGVGATSNGKAKVTPREYENNRYLFTIKDDKGCSHDTAVFVFVEKSHFTFPSDSILYIGDELEFSDNTSWTSNSSWNLGDSSKVDGVEILHAYYNQNTYRVILNSYSDDGCMDADTQYVKILPRKLEIAEINIFSPNGDGVNDLFTFFKEEDSYLKSGGLTQMPANIVEFRGKIYNRFGQTMVKWDNIHDAIRGWDGTVGNNGERFSPPGTYFYDIIVKGKDGSQIKRSGTIFLYKGK